MSKAKFNYCLEKFLKLQSNDIHSHSMQVQTGKMEYAIDHKMRRNEIAKKSKLLTWTSELLEDLKEFHLVISKNSEEDFEKQQKVVELDSDHEEQYRPYEASSGWGTDQEY